VGRERARSNAARLSQTSGRGAPRILILYYEGEPGRRRCHNTRDEARRMAANITKLPELSRGLPSH
jgi:hypothetical protein